LYPISVISHCSAILMVYIFTLICQQVAIVLEHFFTMMVGSGLMDMLCLIVLLQFIVPYSVILLY
jgi:hypothetical protein